MKNAGLKFCMFLCLAFCSFKLGEFVKSKIPPFKEGTCYYSKQYPEMVIKIKTNHVIEGYSDVEVQMITVKVDSSASFGYLRNDLEEKAPCL